MANEFFELIQMLESRIKRQRLELVRSESQLAGARVASSKQGDLLDPVVKK